jgi:diadenosine tetraphosphate (Ap4A) HIT family hydrolase
LASTSEYFSSSAPFAISDGFPVAQGHSLVVTKRLIPNWFDATWFDATWFDATWFDATVDEQAAMMELVNLIKQKLDETLRPKPDGYNMGFNAGSAAGQTVDHVHIHVISRFLGDVVDPRGGVRHVIPSKASYLNPPKKKPDDDPIHSRPLLSAGYPASPLWEHLAWRIAGATSVDVLVSFVQSSGLDVIEERLFEALANEADVRILVSDYLYISDPRALQTLLGWCALEVDEFPSQLGSAGLRPQLDADAACCCGDSCLDGGVGGCWGLTWGHNSGAGWLTRGAVWGCVNRLGWDAMVDSGRCCLGTDSLRGLIFL